MLARDAISGKEGKVTAEFDGRQVTLLEVKNITATVTKEKSTFKALGHRGTQHKATGWSGAGTMTIYYATSQWAKIMRNYINTGEDIYFPLTIENADAGSKLGTQEVTLYDCNIDSLDLAKLDVDATFLDITVAFTFSGVEMGSQFEDLETVSAETEG